MDYEFINDEQNEDPKDGFFDLEKTDICKDHAHDPPTHLYIPPGKGYRHKCKSCGKITTIIPQQISF